MIFDTHSHLQFGDYGDISEEIAKMSMYWVKYTTLIWSDFELSKKWLELAKKHDCFFAAVWIHPDDVWEMDDIDFEVVKIDKLIAENRENIVAIWEIWFDYSRLESWKEELIKEKQKKLFFAQAKLALKYNLPVVIHTRNASEDTLKNLFGTWLKKFVIHCFTESLDFAKEIMGNCSLTL